MCFFTGNYKVEVFDRNQNQYVPTMTGLGMHVEVRDPEHKIVMSRVRKNPQLYPVNPCY